MVCGFFNVSHWTYNHCRDLWDYSPYPRRLDSLTICRGNYKGSTFSSVLLRPWAMIRSESDSRPPAYQPDAQPTEPAVRGKTLNNRATLGINSLQSPASTRRPNGPSWKVSMALLPIYRSLESAWSSRQTSFPPVRRRRVNGYVLWNRCCSHEVKFWLRLSWRQSQRF